MRNKINLLLIFYFVLQLSCSVKSINKFDIKPIIDSALLSVSKSGQPVNLNLCEKVPFKWDALIIIPPYNELDVIDKENLENVKSLEKLMPGLTADEGYCLLLFIEHKTIVSYSLVQRVDLDFNQLIGEDHTMLKISRTLACQRLVVKKVNNGFVPSLYHTSGI